MGDCVLDDQSLDSFGMGKYLAKADGTAVVLHIECVARES